MDTERMKELIAQREAIDVELTELVLSASVKPQAKRGRPRKDAQAASETTDEQTT